MDNWGEGVVPACREQPSERFALNCFSILLKIVVLI
jgi:hypothetical protein